MLPSVKSKRHSRHRSRSAKHEARKQGRRHEPNQKKELIQGRVQKRSAQGFAFLLPLRKGLPDAYVDRDQARLLLNEDIVEYTLQRRGKRFEARVRRVVRHGQREVLGSVERMGRGYAIETIQGETFAVRESRHHPPLGAWVRARIETYPTEHAAATVSVEEVLGERLEPTHDTAIAIARFGLWSEFSEKALGDALQGRRHAEEARRHLGERQDLRQLPFVTIDGADAKDFDDAILVEETKSGFRLRVAIADVAHFVRLGSSLDHEARRRGTSVYFPGSVIPMLPEELSNNLCSLRPREERLALVADMSCDVFGNVQGSKFYEGLIQTAARLTYDDVHDFFKGDHHAKAKWLSLTAPLMAAKHLFLKMRKLRDERGALDFELPECKIEVDARARPIKVGPAQRFESHKVIEEFMIAANRAVAKALRESKTPSLYRIHESPDPSALDEANQLLRTFGVSPVLPDLTPKSFARLLERTKGHKNAPTLHQAILRMQKQAHYGPEPKGHFGLALKDYTHFTSPIRRYPDLVVHRALKQLIFKKKSSDKEDEEESSLDAVGQQTSECERRAMEAERFVVRRKQCWFFRDRLGDVFEGRVTGLTANGLFVEMLPHATEGFLPLEAMDGFWQYDERRQCMRRRPGGNVLTAGDSLKVQVVDVSLDENRITLGQRE